MRTNLDKKFRTDKNLEQQGVDLVLDSGVVLRVKRFGGSNSVEMQKALARHYKPVAQKISAGVLTPAEINAIDAKILADACLVGWTGVTDENGAEVPFSKEKAVEILSELPELTSTVMSYASNYETFREDVGNS